MYCTQCGTAQAPGATTCPQCGRPIGIPAELPAIPNYLILSIFTTLCCCLPLGIVALVFSAQVNTKLAAGDVAGAQRASNSARTWSIIALVAGIVTTGGVSLLTLL